jgi:hypothetical protein
VLLRCLLSRSRASNQAVAWDSVIEQFKFFLPFLAGITLMQTRPRGYGPAWTDRAGAGPGRFEMNLSYLRGFNQARELGLLGDNNTVRRQPRHGHRPPRIPEPFRRRALAEDRWPLPAARMILHTVLLTFSRGGILSLIVAGAPSSS